MNRAFASSSPQNRTFVENHLRNLIVKATKNNTMWATDWSSIPLPSPSPPKKRKITIPKTTNVFQSDSDEDEALSHLVPAQRAAEIARRTQRSKRFKAQEDLRSELQSRAQSEVAHQRAHFLAGGQEGNPDIIDWDKDTILGTCTKLDKSYLRLTSVP